MKPSTTRDETYRQGETAILFVDMQKLFCTPGGDPQHPELDANHFFHKQLAATVIPNQVRLLNAARASGVQVLHTIIEALTADCRDCSLDHKLSHLMIPKGLPAAQPIDVLTPVENEILLPKTSSGVFNSTNIDYVLKNLGIRYLVVAGVVTDQCVDMAVRDAADRGYLVTCVSDACTTYTAARHDNALKAFGGYCWTADTAEVVRRFEALAEQAA